MAAANEPGTPHMFQPESRLEFKAAEEDQEPVPALQELSHTELLSQKAVKHTDSLHPSPPYYRSWED